MLNPKKRSIPRALLGGQPPNRGHGSPHADPRKSASSPREPTDPRAPTLEQARANAAKQHAARQNLDNARDRRRREQEDLAAVTQSVAFAPQDRALLVDTLTLLRAEARRRSAARDACLGLLAVGDRMLELAKALPAEGGVREELERIREGLLEGMSPGTPDQEMGEGPQPTEESAGSEEEPEDETELDRAD